MKKLFSLFFLILILPIASADIYYDCEIYGTCEPIEEERIINVYQNLTSNSTDFWDYLDTPADFLLSMFDGASWIDEALDLNSNDLDNVKNIDIQENITADGVSPANWLVGFKGIDTKSASSFFVQVKKKFLFKVEGTTDKILEVNITAVKSYLPFFAREGVYAIGNVSVIGNVTADYFFGNASYIDKFRDATKLQGFSVSTDAPTGGYFMYWSGNKWEAHDINLDEIDDGATHGRILNTELQFGEILHSAIDHDQTTNVHQDVNTDASPTFDDLTLTDDFFPSAKGMTIPLPSAGSSNPAFNMVNQLLLGVFFNRTQGAVGYIDFGKGASQSHSFGVLGGVAGDVFHSGDIRIGGLAGGSGADYACISADGTLYRRASPCDAG